MDTITTPLAVALSGMRAIPQYFIWRLEWDGIAGKYQKTPCARDGSKYRVDASKSDNWMSYPDAVATLAALPQLPELRYALGFWMTADAGYWFLDLDKAKGVPFAEQLVGAMPGALVELSSSGQGLHVIGRGPVPKHRSKPAKDIAARLLPLQLEFYTSGRGIAFGLSGEAQGSADAEFDMTQLVDAYFAPRVAVDGSARGDWRGPEDDDVLIERMLAARVSAEAAFGGKASVGQLWRGEVERESGADMALASHLAFWTGCDMPRMLKLMWRSGLVRDKWSDHATYLTLTIGNAIDGCSAVYQERVPSSLPLPQATPGTVRNAADLLKLEFKPVQWAIRDILPEGVTILSGDPKIGKSWLVYQACVVIATGSAMWHGRNAEVQGEALMLALEDNDRRLRRRLEKLLHAFPGKSPDKLHYVTEWPRAEAGVVAIADWLRMHPDCRIVVIDTISAFRDSDPGRKSAYAHDYSVGEMLKPLAREFNCAIVLVMHNRKQAAGDVMHKVSGTQGMTGSVDNVLILERGRGDSDAVLHVDGRDIEQQQELALRLNDGVWSFLGNAEDVQRSKERNAVLEAMATLGGCGTAKEIHEAIGGAGTLNAVKVRLSRMHKASEVEKNGLIYTRTNPIANLTPPNLPLP